VRVKHEQESTARSGRHALCMEVQGKTLREYPGRSGGPGIGVRGSDEDARKQV